MKIFDLVRFKKPGKNKFDLGHGMKGTANMGDLIPTMCIEALPGDSFQFTPEMMMRLMPLVSPTMHRARVFFHTFAVPIRIIWSQWEDFITGGEDGIQAPVSPYMMAPVDSDPGAVELFKKGTDFDYMGCPPIPDDMTTATSKLKVSTLPFRAKLQIYNDYYRNQNVEPEITFSKGSGDESANTTNIIAMLETRKRAWGKDYFTSALPNSQRGPEITLPFEAEVEYLQQSIVKRSDTGATMSNNDLRATTQSVPDYPPGSLSFTNQPAGTLDDGTAVRIENIAGITASNITVNAIRRATRLQTVLEKAAVGGARYVEYIKAFFGVTSDDARLQRAEYITGSSMPITFSEVLSTVETDTVPQANMAGHGVSMGGGKSGHYFAKEHCYIITMMSVLPDTEYMQGLPRMFSRETRFDWPLPELAHIGEQEVLNKELYHEYETADVPADEVFGYQSRYCEWKYKNSTVHGELRDTLDFWTMARKFQAYPSLNADFIKADPTHRIFADTDPAGDKLIFQLYNHVSAIRALPYFGTPSL